MVLAREGLNMRQDRFKFVLVDWVTMGTVLIRIGTDSQEAVVCVLLFLD